MSFLLLVCFHIQVIIRTNDLAVNELALYAEDPGNMSVYLIWVSQVMNSVRNNTGIILISLSIIYSQFQTE